MSYVRRPSRRVRALVRGTDLGPGDVVRRSAGEDRDQARKHLVELFAVVGDDDPRVGTARRQLTAALF